MRLSSVALIDRCNLPQGPTTTSKRRSLKRRSFSNSPVIYAAFRAARKLQLRRKLFRHYNVMIASIRCIRRATFEKPAKKLGANRTKTLLPSARKTKQIFYTHYILDEARIRGKREKDTAAVVRRVKGRERRRDRVSKRRASQLAHTSPA